MIVEMLKLPPPQGPSAWRQLGDEEFAAIWEKFSAVPPPGAPTKTYVVPAAFDSRTPEAQLLLSEFHSTLLQHFCACLPPGRKLFALDYHHASFEFDPHALPRSGATHPWPVTLLPEGDDTIYVAYDLSFGTCSAWNPESLTFFGAGLLACLDGKRPRLLSGWEVRA